MVGHGRRGRGHAAAGVPDWLACRDHAALCRGIGAGAEGQAAGAGRCDGHQDGLTVICKVDPQKTGDGTLFVADISIYDSADEHAPEAIYAITTASYQGVE